MADIFTPGKRSAIMARIKSKDTKPERQVRSLLHRMGYRFRLHCPDLPGKPDIVLPRYRTVIFVHGCFWHRHPGCRLAYTPKTRQEFWIAKFEGTVNHDAQVMNELCQLEWTVVIVWECQLQDTDSLAERLRAALRTAAADEPAPGRSSKGQKAASRT